MVLDYIFAIYTYHYYKTYLIAALEISYVKVFASTFYIHGTILHIREFKTYELYDIKLL